eukprot:759022-Rhodomonas_salina.1
MGRWDACRYIQGAAVGNAHACNNLGFILMCEAQPEAAALLFDAAGLPRPCLSHPTFPFPRSPFPVPRSLSPVVPGPRDVVPKPRQ